jgi:cysteine desulfurase
MPLMKVYLDNAATTQCDQRVVEAMLPFFTSTYAVASSEFSHSPGIEAREALDHAREVIAGTLKAKPEELIFTSSATESNNLALKGITRAHLKKGKHLITSAVEHRSVKSTAAFLEKEGFAITVLPVSREGIVSLEDLKKAIRKETILVSIQHANQETGAIQDVAAIGKLCKEKSILFHTDASLAFGRIPIDVNTAHIDLLSITSHLIHGPKGIGALFIRNGVQIQKIMHGGFNEYNKRAGVENIGGAVGFANAVELIEGDEHVRIGALKKRLYDGIMNQLASAQLNGSMEYSLPTILNLTFRYIEGESVILHLDMRGIAVITGSACFSRSLEPSFVLKAMGLSHEEAHGSIRFSFSRFNTEEEIDYTISAVCDVVKKLRQISPIAPDKEKK